MVLTDDSFDKVAVDPSSLTARGTWFVKFYAPWCGHCKKLAPTWDELSNVVTDDVKVGKVDCTVHSDTCSRFDIKGYPTLILLSGDSFYKYKGARDVTSLASFPATYKDADIETGKIAKKLEGMEKIQKMGNSIAEEFKFSIKMLFDKMGMGHIDETIQIAVAILLFTLPIIMLFVLLCFCGDDPVPQPTAPGTKKDAPKGKRDKLD